MHIERTVEVQVPVRTAYNQWTQFEQFPNYMVDIDWIRQIDDARVEWRATSHGRQLMGVAQIVRQVPDRRIDWKSEDGPSHSGSVEFEPIDARSSRITLRLEFGPEKRSPWDFLKGNPAARHAEEDLQRFKEFIETRGKETGAWRGSIPTGSGEIGAMN